MLGASGLSRSCSIARRGGGRGNGGCGGGGRGGRGRGGGGRGGPGGGGRCGGGHSGGSLGGMQQPTGSEAATAIPTMLFGADVMKEGGEEEAGASEGEESDEGGDEGSSLGKGVANTPSWLHECFESPEAEQEYWVSRSGRICSGRSSEG